MDSLPPAETFYPRNHVEQHLLITWVDEHGRTRRLSPAAKLLALWYGNHVRMMVAGTKEAWVAWHSLDHLSEKLGLTVKTVSVARRDLEASGLFAVRRNVREITVDKKKYDTSKVHVFELVRDVEAFRQARDAARARERRETDAATQRARVLGPQRAELAGEIDADERQRQERQIRTEHRRSKRRVVKITNKDRDARTA